MKQAASHATPAQEVPKKQSKLSNNKEAPITLSDGTSAIKVELEYLKVRAWEKSMRQLNEKDNKLAEWVAVRLVRGRAAHAGTSVPPGPWWKAPKAERVEAIEIELMGEACGELSSGC